MRNLKRVLSLALASVMLLGMMVIGAGAADYTDNASITQIEAAQVLEAINVMEGNDKGEFLPTADLTREAAAKIITYMLLGKKGADDLTTGSAPFDDVEATRWSAGSIAYCAKMGIISGDGKGNFFPTATVTGTQFAKMLLGALGYEAKHEGFTGPGYELKIANIVASTRLNKGIDSRLSDTLTREEAARMALNTLTSFLVEYTGGIDINTGDSQITSTPTRQYMKVTAVDGVERPRSFMSLYQTSLKYDTTATGTYGRPSHKWTLGRTEIGTYANEVDLSYTAKPALNDLKNDLSGFHLSYLVGSTSYASRVTINGMPAGTVSTPEDLRNYMGAGRLVELYADSVYGITDVIIVDSVLAQIGGINTTAKEVRLTPMSFTGTLPGGALNNTVQIVTETNNKKMYEKLSEMKVDDYILVTFDGTKIASVATPESITGTYTGYNSANNKRTIAGNTYDDSYATKNFDVLPTPTSHLSDKMAGNTIGNDYIVYMDSYGNPIYATADVTTSNKYAYVLDTEPTGNLSVEGRVYNAKLLFTDGTQQWVKVAAIDNRAASSSGNFEASYFNVLEGKFVSYAVRADGSYAMTTVQNGSRDGSGNYLTVTNTPLAYSEINVSITKDAVNFLPSISNAMGSSKTVFLVQAGDGTYKAYNGIRNISNWTGVDVKLFNNANTTSANMVIVSKTGGVTTVEKDLVYLLSGSYNVNIVDNRTVYTYNAVVDGKVTTFDTLNAAGGRGLYLINSYTGDYADSLTATGASAYSATDGYVVGTMAANGLKYNNGTLTLDTAVSGSPVGFVTSSDFVMIAVRNDTNAAGEISPSQLQYYNSAKIGQFVITLDDDGIATSAIFVYDL